MIPSGHALRDLTPWPPLQRSWRGGNGRRGEFYVAAALRGRPPPQVDISHTFIGDLRVDLIAPGGAAVVLHNNTGGSANDLVRTYSVLDTPALRPLLDQSIRGTWQLRVRDTFRLDVGRLNRWRIAARVAGAAPGPLAAEPADAAARQEEPALAGSASR